MFSCVTCNMKKDKKNKSINLVLLGLDEAGKTSILNKISTNQDLGSFTDLGFKPPSTCGFNLRAYSYCKRNITVYDCGGKKEFRELWEYYCQNVDGVIYVIDSSDASRLEEAGLELINVLKNPILANKPLLILANKGDLEGSLSCDRLTDYYGFKDINDREWFIMQTSAIDGKGVHQGLMWITKIAIDSKY